MVDLDTGLRLLANEHRRRLLLELLSHNPQEGVTFTDGIRPEEGDRDALRVEMIHTHLPLLEDNDLIEWDPDSNEVTKGPNFGAIRPLLEMLDDHVDG